VLRVLGQIAATFIIAEGPDGMYMIDQHAAHERIMFERLMADYVARAPDRQLLLEPVALDLSPRSWEMYLSCRDDLSGLGFDLDEFGGASILIRAVPAKLRVRDPARMVEVVLDELVSGGRGESRLESLAISAACHASIRANQPLSLLEMRELVVQLERCASPLACGHGRPTMLRMTAEDLERQFSRR
ncbi:MAG TPA: DNA mismatch repair protein MutL, partial [Thermomicrobiales bacterium]|nr:DNA mismatch repair protein MutL [Thermomicrobiales bacterium]